MKMQIACIAKELMGLYLFKNLYEPAFILSIARVNTCFQKKVFHRVQLHVDENTVKHSYGELAYSKFMPTVRWIFISCNFSI